jgi:DNA-binding PadR family transcriptional regulator
MFGSGFGHCGGHRHCRGFMERGGYWFMHRGRGGGGPAWDEGGRGGRGPLGGGGGRGRVFGPGDLRLLLLSLIEEKPRHGYELIKELEQKFGGGYAPSPGSVYPTLTLLEELGLVSSTATSGTRRLFTITQEGKRFLEENAAAVESARARMDMAARAVSGDVAPREVHHALYVLRAALMFHRGGWDGPETERVRKILDDAAAAISRGRSGD